MKGKKPRRTVRQTEIRIPIHRPFVLTSVNGIPVKRTRFNRGDAIRVVMQKSY